MELAVENAVNKTISEGGKEKYYGKCAEINVINQAILAGETLDTLKGATIDTRFNRDRKETEKVKGAKVGDPAEVCDYCKKVLKKLGIIDKNKGCGNR